MRKNQLVALLCLLSLTTFGQRIVSIQATATPTLVRTAYDRMYLYPESDGQVVEPVFLVGTINSAGYTAGLTAHYAYAPGWSVAAGVWYSQHQVSLRQTNPAAPGEVTTTLRSRTVRVPLLLSYQSSTRRLSPYFSLGLLLDFPMTARVVATRSGQPTQRLRLTTDGGPVFQSLVGAGGRYRLSPRCALVVQPAWSYNLGRFGGAQTYRSSTELSLLTQVTYTF